MRISDTMSCSGRAGHRAKLRSPVSRKEIQNSRRVGTPAGQAQVIEQGGRTARRYQTRGVLADSQMLSACGTHGRAAACSLLMRGSTAVARSTGGGDDDD